MVPDRDLQKKMGTPLLPTTAMPKASKKADFPMRATRVSQPRMRSNSFAHKLAVICARAGGKLNELGSAHRSLSASPTSRPNFSSYGAQPTVDGKHPALRTREVDFPTPRNCAPATATVEPVWPGFNNWALSTSHWAQIARLGAPRHYHISIAEVANRAYFTAFAQVTRGKAAARLATMGRR